MLIRITGCAYESRSNGGRERRKREGETISIETERLREQNGFKVRERERKTISIESERAKLVFSPSYKVKL